MEMSRWLVWRASVFLWISGFVRRMTLGVRVIVVDGDKVLMIKHTYLPGWHFPGGGVDGGEGVHEGAVRETFEETGIQVHEPMRLFGMYRNTIPPGRDHVAVFVCDRFEVKLPFTPNREIAEIGWFDVNDLPEGTSKATQLRIAEVFHGATPSYTWRD